MLTLLLSAIPMAILWMLITGYIEPFSFVLGYAIGLVLLLLFRPKPVDLADLPGRLGAAAQYAFRVGVDTVLSTLDVARRVLAPSLPVTPGFVDVNAQDDGETTAALSAYAITITPGELVVDFESDNDMVVHTLDLERTTKEGNEEQGKRLKIIRRMVADDE